MKAYSMDLRNRVLADCDAGMEARQVAVKYNVSESWIRRLRQRRQESGETAPRRPKTSPPKWQPYADSIEQFVTDQPDATLAELKEHLEIPLSIPTLPGAIALRFTLKKSLRAGGTGPAGRRQPTRGLAEVAKARGRSRGHEPVRLYRRDLGLDEHEPPIWPQPKRSAADRCRPPWALEDHDVRGGTPAGGTHRAVVIDGAINGRIFLAYVR